MTYAAPLVSFPATVSTPEGVAQVAAECAGVAMTPVVISPTATRSAALLRAIFFIVIPPSVAHQQRLLGEHN